MLSLRQLKGSQANDTRVLTCNPLVAMRDFFSHLSGGLLPDYNIGTPIINTSIDKIEEETGQVNRGLMWTFVSQLVVARAKHCRA